ncbi:hypothetical protein LguiA_012896 [Lonicera macranthoides]
MKENMINAFFELFAQYTPRWGQAPKRPPLLNYITCVSLTLKRKPSEHFNFCWNSMLPDEFRQ